jgi:formylmethanofuran dehydrogenase subunit B
VLIVGPDPLPAFPRLFERCLEPQRTLFSETPLARQLIRLGPPAEPRAAASAGIEPSEIPCAVERLPEAIAALATLLRGRTIASDIPGLDRARLSGLADGMKAARYAVIVWAPALLDLPGAELVAQMLLDIVRELNRTTRAALLPLAGSANLLGVNQVCTWQTGYPLRTAFGGGSPDHDPYRFSARRMVEQGEADALISISAFGDAPPPASGNLPTVVLAPPNAAPGRPVAAYIPVGVPGVDHAGQLFRTDSVVALQVSALRTTSLPDVRSIIAEIEAGLADRDRIP